MKLLITLVLSLLIIPAVFAGDIQQALIEHYSADYSEQIKQAYTDLGLGWFMAILFGPLICGVTMTITTIMGIRRQNRQEKKLPIEPGKLRKITNREGRKWGIGSILLLQGVAARITTMPFMIELVVLGLFTGPISTRAYELLRLVAKMGMAGDGPWSKRWQVLDDWLAVRHDKALGHLVPVDDEGNEIPVTVFMGSPGTICPTCHQKLDDETIPRHGSP